MNTKVLDKAYEVLARAAGGPNRSIWTDLIEALLPILLDLLENCVRSGGNAQEILNLARSPDRRDKRNARLLIKRSVRRSLWQEYGWLAYQQRDGDKIVETFIAAANDPEVTSQDISELANLAV